METLQWKPWKQELYLYFVATQKYKQENKVKSSIILSCIENKAKILLCFCSNTSTFSKEEERVDYNLLYS